MGYLTAMHPDSVFRKAFDLRRIHRVIGLSSLGLTTVAVISGIMDKLPYGTCFYPHTSPYSIDVDPAENYTYVPGSCRIAHGLGVSVVIGALLTVLSVVLRADHNSGHAPASTKVVPVSPVVQNFGVVP